MQNNKVRAVLVKVGHEPKAIEVENDLKPLQDIVGGYLQYYPLFDSDSMVILCDEDGRTKELKDNAYLLHRNTTILGDILVMAISNGETVSLTDEQVEYALKTFSYGEGIFRCYPFVKENKAD